jgi:hypothetical protein
MMNLTLHQGHNENESILDSFSFFLWLSYIRLLIYVSGTSLSAGENYEKAQVPAFSKNKFFLAGAEPAGSTRLERRSTGLKNHVIPKLHKSLLKDINTFQIY